jgi:PST family polysaccharide transporter
MKFITYIRVGYKIIFVSLVITLVNNPEDFWLVPLIDGIGSILAGLYSLYIINKNHQINFSTINFSKAINQLKEGWHIFISKFAVILYSTINTFLLGILSTNENVGYYSIVEKIYLALRGGLSPLTQAIFPYLSKVYKQNKYNFYKIVRKISIFYFILIFIISISMYFFSSHIIGLILGEYNYQTIEIFKIFSFTFFFSIGGLYSLLLIIKNQGKLLSKITMKLVIINIILVYPVIYYWNIFGLAYLFMFIQILQFVMQINYNKEFFSKKTYDLQKEKND